MTVHGDGQEVETEVVTEIEIGKTSNASRAEAEAISRLIAPGETLQEAEEAEAEVEVETTAILEVETAMMILPEEA